MSKSLEWEQLHKQSVVTDLHNHSVLKHFLLDRDMSGGKTKFLAKLFKRGFWPLSQRSNFPLIDKGGLDIVLSTCYVPEVEWLEDQPLAKFLLWLSPSVRKRVFDPTYFDATIAMMDSMEEEAEKYNHKIKPDRLIQFVKNKNELIDALAAKNIAMIHSVEGSHSLQGKVCGKSLNLENPQALPDTQFKMGSIEEEVLQNLEHLANRGVAYLTLAHFYPNHVVSPVFPYPTYGIKRSNWKKLMAGWDMNKGLTAIGVKVVNKMIDLGMLIDVAHCTPKARAEIYEIVGNRNHCVLASHSGAFEIHRDPYNLEDWELKWIADHGGVTGIIFMNYWLSPNDSPLGLKYIEETINHIGNVAGMDSVGLGTDYDGFTDPPDEMVDISEIPRLTRYLSSLNRYSDDEIRNILGGNSLRLLMAGWGK